LALLERKGPQRCAHTSRKLAERKLYIQETESAHGHMSAEELEYVRLSAAEKLNRYDHKKGLK